MSQVTSTASRVGGNNVRQLGRAVSHFACVQVVWPQWEPILDNLATLISDLHKSAEGRVTLPYGSTLDVQEAFERESSSNQPALAALWSKYTTGFARRSPFTKALACWDSEGVFLAFSAGLGCCNEFTCSQAAIRNSPSSDRLANIHNPTPITHGNQQILRPSQVLLHPKLVIAKLAATKLVPASTL